MLFSSHPRTCVSGKLTPVIDLVVARIDRALEQLINLLLAHLLAEVCQDVLDLALADKPAAVFVEHLESADVLLDVEGLAEAAGAVEDLGEGVEVDWGALAGKTLAKLLIRRWMPWVWEERRTVSAYAALEVRDLSQSRVLSACAQQVAEGAAVNTPIAALVEELERFAVVGGGLVVVIHCVLVRFVVFVRMFISGRRERRGRERARCLASCGVTVVLCNAVKQQAAQKGLLCLALLTGNGSREQPTTTLGAPLTSRRPLCL